MISSQAGNWADKTGRAIKEEFQSQICEDELGGSMKIGQGAAYIVTFLIALERRQDLPTSPRESSGRQEQLTPWFKARLLTSGD